MKRIRSFPVRLALVALALLAVDAAHALNVEIQMNPDPVRPAERLRADITIANDGNSSVANVTLEAAVPVGVQDGSLLTEAMLSGGGQCNTVGPTNNCSVGEVIVWDLGTLAAGEGITVTVPMLVSATALDGSDITMTARGLIGGVQDDTDSKTVRVDVDGVLQLTLDQDRSTAQNGGTIIFTLTYANRSINATSNTTLSLPLPPELTFVSATGGGTFNGGTNQVEWDLGSLPGEQTGREQVVATVGVLTAGDLIDMDDAEIAGTNIVGGGSESADASEVTRITASSPLQLALEMNPNPVEPDERMRSELTVSNDGIATLSNVTLTAWVPDQVKDGSNLIEAVLSGGGQCNTVGPTNNCSKGEQIVWDLGSIGAGNGVTVVLPALVASALDPGQLIQLHAQVSADGGTQALGSHTVFVEPDPLLRLHLNEDRDVVQGAETLIYTLTYSNLGINEVQSTTLRLPLPVGTTFNKATGDGQLNGGAVEWNLGNVPGLTSGVQQAVLNVNIAAVSNGQILAVDAAEIAGTNAVTTDPLVSRATAVSRVSNLRPLELFIEMNPDPASPDQLLRSELTVSNSSIAALNNVQLLAWVPDQVKGANSLVEGILTGGGQCNTVGPTSNCSNGEIVVWDLGTVASGSAATVALPAIVASGLGDGRLIQLDAMVTADGGGQAQAGHAVAVGNDPALSLELNESPDSDVAGGTVTYTLTYGNRGINSITDASLRLPLPAGMTFVSATGGGQFAASAVQWNLGTIFGSRGGYRQAVFEPLGNLANGTLLPVNAATLDGIDLATTAELQARATAVTRIADTNPLRLSVDTMAPSQQGDTMTAAITVTNAAAFNLADVTIKARVPQQVKDSGFLPETAMSDGGQCNALGPTTTCSATELVVWSLGQLNASQSRTVTMMPIVRDDLVDGQVITIDAEATTTTVPAQPVAADTVLIGPDADSDLDGMPDDFEIPNGLNPNNPADASQDPDMDTLSSYDEFLGGDQSNSGRHGRRRRERCRRCIPARSD